MPAFAVEAKSSGRKGDAMKPLLLLLVAPFLFAAEPTGRLILDDNFERNESDEAVEEIGNDWETNSKSRAKGNKQADLRDGALYIHRHKVADHGASVKHVAEFKDGTIQMRFKLEHAKDTLGINIADMKEKSVHAGHLFKVIAGTKHLQIQDLKTGVMKQEHRTARKAGKVSPELQKLLASKTKKFPVQLELNTWHDILLEVDGKTATVQLNGKKAGSFTSEGIAHPTKRLLRIAVAREVVIDDVMVFARE